MSSIMTWGDQGKMGEYREDAFYPTPWQPTQALMELEADALKDYPIIAEYACGDGAMAEVIKENGHDVDASDLIDRGYGRTGVDFLKLSLTKNYPSALITNPPFTDNDKKPLAEGFIRQAHRLRFKYVAMLLKSNFWHADCRVQLWHDHTPARIYPMAWRIDFTGSGRNHFDCIWCVWDKSYIGPCLTMPPIQRPKSQAQPYLF